MPAMDALAHAALSQVLQVTEPDAIADLRRAHREQLAMQAEDSRAHVQREADIDGTNALRCALRYLLLTHSASVRMHIASGGLLGAESAYYLHAVFVHDDCAFLIDSGREASFIGLLPNISDNLGELGLLVAQIHEDESSAVSEDESDEDL